MRDDVLRIGPAIPGAVLRGGGAAVAVLGAWAAGAPLFWIAFAAAAALVGAIVPRTRLAWFALAAIPIAVMLQPPDLARTCLAVAAIHLGHVLATVSGIVTLRSKVALRALVPSGWRALIVQLAGQASAILAFAIPAADGRGSAWIAPVGAAAVAVTALILVRAISQKKHGVR